MIPRAMGNIEIHPDLRLPPSTRVALVSDVHLGDGSAGDLFGKKDALFLSTIQRESDAADVLVINGDAVDHMQARSTRRMEKAHTRVFDALRELSRRKPVIYVLGNHERPADLRQSFPDFDYVSALRVGDDLCITHGHQFDLHWKDGGGMHSLAKLHSLVETYGNRPVRQPLRDYDNGLNRVIHRVFFRLTQGLRLYGQVCRLLGSERQYEAWRQVDNFWARGQWGDLGCIFECAQAYLLGDVPWRTLILGHSHQPGVVKVRRGARRSPGGRGPGEGSDGDGSAGDGGGGERTYANLGTWAFDLATFARIEEGQVRVFDARSGREYRDERYRILISGEPLPDMATWFARYYHPFFRYDFEAIRRDFPSYSQESQLASSEFDPTPDAGPVGFRHGDPKS